MHSPEALRRCFIGVGRVAAARHREGDDWRRLLGPSAGPHDWRLPDTVDRRAPSVIIEQTGAA